MIFLELHSFLLKKCLIVLVLFIAARHVIWVRLLKFKCFFKFLDLNTDGFLLLVSHCNVIPYKPKAFGF